MRIHLTVESSNQMHTWLRFHIDGAFTGKLFMHTDEAHRFVDVMQTGCEARAEQFELTGVLASNPTQRGGKQANAL